MQEAATTQKTILVVDDEDGVRESVREVLSDEGYRVVDTADGTEVLRIIKEHRPELVLLDIWMPQMDGIGLLKEIKSLKPDINVVMVSGHGNIHTAVTATKFGAFDFIEKPVSLDGLLSTVQRALGEVSGGDGKRQSGARVKKNRAGKAAPLKSVGTAQVIKQKTLAKSVVLSGQGLHSGVKTGLILHPLPPNSGTPPWRPDGPAGRIARMFGTLCRNGYCRFSAIAMSLRSRPTLTSWRSCSSR